MSSIPQRKKTSARLRKFPYPYKAALTILSDRHGLQTAGEFRLFHRFLNTTQETPKGKGLGLEIGDTFWFYDELGRFSYFDKYSNRLSDQAPVIRDYYASGYIDCLHTWGDFSNLPFERKYAEWVVEECAATGMTLPIWVNHGNVHNTHNINRDVPHHQGAKPGSSSFHVDLLFQAGFRVLWRFLTPIIGQDRPLSLGEHLSIGSEQSSSRASFVTKRIAKRSLMAIDRELGGICRYHRENMDNEFLAEATLDNGQRVHEFRRFNNHPVNIWHGMHVPDLLRQLHADVLDRLTEVGGYMVVYNHLEYGDFYHPDIVAVLRDLGRREQEGNIWVTTTAKLVRYNQVFHGLRWSEQMSSGGAIVISIEPTRTDSVFGSTPVTSGDLEGITFFVPRTVRSLDIRLGNETVPHTVYESGGEHLIAGIPVRRLHFPE
jgi:hypothetical protein